MSGEKKVEERAHCSTTRSEDLPKVAIIGAGIAGLIAARTLHDRGFSSTVFDKGRGVGGRMATRRTERGLRFDHGAQYFTVRDQIFSTYVDAWLVDGIVAKWAGRVGSISEGIISASERTHDRYVGVPAMNSICKHLAEDLRIQLGTRVSSLARVASMWKLGDATGKSLGEFDWLIITAPAPQTAGLIAAVAPQLAISAQSAKMQGCWAVMVEFSQPLLFGLDGAFIHDSPLSWVARNSSKPGRARGSDCWVLHASPEWSEEHIEKDSTEVTALLLSAFWQATGIPAVTPNHLAAHRWRYAIPEEPLAERCLQDAQLQIVICGDWCDGPRVEGAFLSGMAAAACLAENVSQ